MPLTTYLISFHHAYQSKNELHYLSQVTQQIQKSGNGPFYEKCSSLIHQLFNFHSTVLTNSATDALELAAIMIDIQPGDEVIVPSYTFVSTANAFLLRGAKLVFCDSQTTHPNMCLESLKSLITPKTKAVIPVHYGGKPAPMTEIMRLSEIHNFYVIEDAAQCIGSQYPDTNRMVGSEGHLSCFSFHDTKNIHCGEGGMLVINFDPLKERAFILRDKGTNRAQFLKGQVDKYTWVDIGSSFLPSEYQTAVLHSQLEELDRVTETRISLWKIYHQHLSTKMTHLPPSEPWNAHNFYLVYPKQQERDKAIDIFKKHNIQTAFHYQPLHSSPFGKRFSNSSHLPNAEKFGQGLLRLPLYPQLSEDQVHYIAEIAQTTL